MKKSLLFASALSLVLLAGCAKEQSTGNSQGSESKLNISGSIITPDTKIQIGESTGTTTPVLWNNGDLIGLFAANADNIVPAMTFEGKRISYSGHATATTTEPSSFTTFDFAMMEDITADLSGGEYTMYGVYGLGRLGIEGDDTDITTYFSLPDFTIQTFDPSNTTSLPLFLIGSTPVKGESIDLPFTNAAAMMMLNLKGTAKINKVALSVVDASDAPKNGLAYTGATVDMTKAPIAGTNATEYAAFLHTDNATATNSVTVNISGLSLQLDDTATTIPVGVLPFDLADGDQLLVTVYGQSDTGEEKSVTATFAPGAVSVTTNSIVYLNCDPFTAEELGQTPPKDNWVAGDIVFEDDFSWVKTAVTWSDYDPAAAPGSGMLYTNLGGWTSTFNNSSFPYYNNVDGYQGGATQFLMERGFLTEGHEFYLWYENNGMLLNSDEWGAGSVLSYPLTALNNYKGNVTVTFKASRVTESDGGDNWGGLKATYPVSISGNGTINGATSVSLGSADYAPFTFYEYTLVIENADASTQINFGSRAAGGMYLDDIKIVISDADDTNNLNGTIVAKPAVELAYSSPANNETINLPATKAQKTIVMFKVTGPWKAKYSDNIGTTSSSIDGTNKWLQISGAQWYINGAAREDLYGNMNPTAFQFTNIKDNTTGAERTATLEIVSPDDENIVYATYTFKQAAQ